MNFIFLVSLADDCHARNPNNTYYSNNQGLPDQKFMESMYIYPDRLDALLKARISAEILYHRVCPKILGLKT